MGEDSSRIRRFDRLDLCRLGGISRLRRRRRRCSRRRSRRSSTRENN